MIVAVASDKLNLLGGEELGRRRFQKTGSLSQKSGSWLLKWREDAINPATGAIVREHRSKVIAKSKGPEALTKRQAQSLANETVLAKVNANTSTPGSSLTVEAFARGRFTQDHIDHLKPAGQDHYKYMLENHILPFLGKYRLREVSPLILQTFFSAKRKSGYILRTMETVKGSSERREKLTRREFSTQTLTHMRTVISTMFNCAQDWDLHNGKIPTRGVRLPKLEHQERSAVTAEQATLLISALPGQYSTLGALLFTTGIRIGEAAGLKWKRVDFAAGCITIREQFSKGQWVTPKTDNSVRIIPVAARVLEQIAALRQRGDHLGPDDTVFVTVHGNPLGSHSIAAKILKPVAKRLGLPWVCWHSFRHSNATFADQQGMTLAERNKTLGHGSNKMGLHYTHAEMETVRAKVEGIALAVLPLVAVEKERVM